MYDQGRIGIIQVTIWPGKAAITKPSLLDIMIKDIELQGQMNSLPAR